MANAHLLIIAVVAATFFVGGIVKGAAGMGLPTLAMGVLGALLSPAVAAALLIVPALVTNVWQLLAGPSAGRLARRLWPMMAAIAVATLESTSLLAHGDTRLTTSALGATLLVYAVYTLLARQLRVPARLESWLSPLVGVATGVVTGGTGVLVVPAVPYLQALGLEKDELVQALGLSFTVSTIALAAGLAMRGAFQVEKLAISTLAVVPALAGMWAGQAIRRRASPATFRRWFLIGLSLLGTEMLARPLFGPRRPPPARASASKSARRSVPRDRARIHPEHLPVVPVGIVEAPAVHEPVIVWVRGVRASRGHGLAHHRVHLLPAVHGEREQRVHLLVGVAERPPAEAREPVAGEEHEVRVRSHQHARRRRVGEVRVEGEAG